MSPPRCGCGWPMPVSISTPELADQPDRIAPAQAGDGSSQLIGFSMVSIFLRSLVYNVLFYLRAGVLGHRRHPDLLMPRWAIMAIARYWARSSIWLMRVICNVKVEYRGLEKIPKGPLIVASKHQSMWETFALLQFFDQPLFHPQARADMDSAVRLVSDQVEHDRRRPRRRWPRADGDGAPRRRGGAPRPPVDHLSGGHAHRCRCAAALQDRRRARSMSIAA